jgi:hypothetical protein
MPIVEVNGQEIEFPDDMPSEQIRAVLQKKFPTQSGAPSMSDDGILQRLQQDFQTRKGRVQELKAQGKPFLAGAKAVGQGAGMVMDVPGELAVSAFRAAPEAIKAPVRAAGELAGRALSPVVKKYEQFKSAHPDVASVAEDVANVGMLLAPARAPKTAKPTAIRASGESLIKRGAEQSKEFIDDLVLPKMTPSVEEARLAAGKVSQGVAGSRKYDLFPVEKRGADLLKSVPGISKYNSIVSNQRIARQAAVDSAQSLMADLDKLGVLIPKREAAAHIRRTAIKNIMENPLVTKASGASETAKKLINQFSKILDESDGTAAGLMRARQKFDAAAERYKGNVFGSASDNAYSFTTREIRNAINDLVEAKAPNVAVKEKLANSHALFTVADNMASRVPDEAKNALGRLVQKVEEVVPGKSEIAKILALGGAATVAPDLAFTAGGIYLSGKALKSAATKKLIGNLLINADKAISAVKDKALLEQLRADRAVLADYIESLPREEKEKGAK